MRMKAMVIDSFGGVDNFHWRDWPMPEPNAGEVRIRIHAISVNPVDYKMRKGLIPGDLPAVLGRDVAGTIDAVGEGVSDFKTGDAVVAVLFGPRSNGAYAEYVTTAAAFVSPKPEGISYSRAATLGVAGLTAYFSVISAGNIQAGETILITGGAGGVGSFAVPLAWFRGAGTVFATAGSRESADHLVGNLSIDPDHIIDHSGRTIEQMDTRIRAQTRGKGVSAAFDFVGGNMKKLCFRATGFDGRVVSIVEEPPDFDFNLWRADISPLFAKSGAFHFVATSARARNGGPGDWTVYRETMAELVGLVDSGALALPRVTELGVLSEETIRDAHTLLEAGHVKGKLTLTVVQ
jgi:NADPH2:quinone reductase